jgi:UDP-GlcNAc:undecaprenyl-phosphate GlcNAc-1-phosphate transferase
MYSLLVLFISSLCVVLVLTPLCRGLAIRWGFVDQPDLVRKFHKSPIPRIGGIPIFIAYLTSFAILLFLNLQGSHTVRGHLGIVKSLCPAAILVFLTGLLDDLIGLKPWQKLGAQFVAAGIAVSSGLQINAVVWHQFPSWIGIPVTIIWLVGCTNAFNLIDGLDGLATGVGLVATTITLIAALLDHNIGMAFAMVPLVGALLGFLRFNFNPASIFMGDSGSLFIGFLLGCYSVLWSQKSATILGMTAPLITLSIPLLDTSVAILRRFLRGQPIFSADHGHIHHKLLARGFTPRRAVVLIYMVCGLCGALSLLQSFEHERFGGLILILLCVGACFGIQRLEYAEFEAAHRLIRLGAAFRRHLNAEMELRTFQNSLAAAATSDRCWELIQDTYSRFGYAEIRLELGGQLFTHRSNTYHVSKTCTLRFNLSENDYLSISREFNTEPPPIVARFNHTVGVILGPKAHQMRPAESARQAIEVAVEHA